MNKLHIFFTLIIKISLSQPIIVDGFFTDWNANTTTFTDDFGDSPGIDLLNFSVYNDEKNIYFRLKLNNEIDLTDSLDLLTYSKIRLFIDKDNNPQTGYPTNGIGSDYGIDFQKKHIWNDIDFPNSIKKSFYWLKLVPLPTITSNEFEICIDRSSFSDTISFYFKEEVNGDKMPNNEGFVYVLNNNTISSLPIITFDKSDSLKIRLMSYNVRANGILDPSRREQIKNILKSTNSDVFTFNETGNISLAEMETFFNEFSSTNWYMFKTNNGDITVSKYPFSQSFNNIDNKIGGNLIDLPDSIYSTDLLVLNGHLACCYSDIARQISADKFIKFILDCKNGLIPLNTPFVFAGDMNLVGYREQYETILNGTISDTASFGIGGYPDWDNTPIVDLVCRFNEDNQSYTWDKYNPSAGDYAPGRLDFIFYSNSVMSIDKSFTISTEHMSANFLSDNHLDINDTKEASDHFPIVADLSVPLNSNLSTNPLAPKTKKLIKIIDTMGRETKPIPNTPLIYLYEDGSIEKKIILK